MQPLLGVLLMRQCFKQGVDGRQRLRSVVLEVGRNAASNIPPTSTSCEGGMQRADGSGGHAERYVIGVRPELPCM